MSVSRKFIWITLLVFGAMMVVLAIGSIDYDLSRSIVDPASIWAEFFNLVGEQPAFWAMFLGLMIIYGARDRSVRWKNAAKTALAVPLFLVSSFQISFIPVHYIFEHTEESVTAGWWVFTVVMTLFLSAAGMAAVNLIDGDKFRKIRKIGLVLFILVISEIIMVNILKVVWARPRMRSIESIDQFRYWYQINGLKNDNELKSFPSGHTANGFVSIAYVMFFNGLKKVWKNIYLAFALTWGALVAVSRVVRGDHFISDVLMSCLLTFILFLIIHKLIYKKGGGNEG